MAEAKHQITSQIVNFQNDFLGVEKRRWQLSNNEDIPIIMSKQVSVALNYNPKNWLLTTEVYFKTIDGITSQSQGFQNQYEFVKTSGSYQVQGLDFLLRKRFASANLWLSYSYMNNEYEFTELAEQRFPSNLDITHAITLGSTYKYRKLKLAAGLNWHSGKPTTRPAIGNEIADGEINYGPSNLERHKDYLRIDASVVYDFNIKNVLANLGFSIWNVLGKENVINNYYRIDEEGAPQEFIQTALVLLPKLRLGFTFNPISQKQGH